jgi:hypothetical protein
LGTPSITKLKKLEASQRARESPAWLRDPAAARGSVELLLDVATRYAYAANPAWRKPDLPGATIRDQLLAHPTAAVEFMVTISWAMIKARTYAEAREIVSNKTEHLPLYPDHLPETNDDTIDEEPPADD